MPRHPGDGAVPPTPRRGRGAIALALLVAYGLAALPLDALLTDDGGASAAGSAVAPISEFVGLPGGGGSRRPPSGRGLIELAPHHLDRYPFTNLAEVSSGPAAPAGGGANATGFYWQIPRSGGTTLKHILGVCLDRVQASRVGRDHCDSYSDALEVCETRFGRYVNADPSDDPGIIRSSEMGLVPSGLADVVVSSRFLHAASLFDDPLEGGGSHRRLPLGRAFTVLRHPVERAVSTFYYLQEATWERNYNPAFKTMSLVEYAKRGDTPHDWMVRWLTGKNHDELERSDVEFAKALLRRKFLVLLTDHMSTSVDRLIRYMGWSDDVSHEQRECAREAALNSMGQNRHSHQRAERGSEEYAALADINKFDIELYNYAVNELVHEQWAIVYRGAGVRWERMNATHDRTVQSALGPQVPTSQG